MSEYIINTSKLIVSKTDSDGAILQANDAFCEISGYSKAELIGQQHNIVRHPDMPSIVFKVLWVKAAYGLETQAFVKNLRKNGQYYWVFATVTPNVNKYGEIDYITSVRKRANPKAVEQIEPFYKKLLSLESPGRYGESALEIQKLLGQTGFKFNNLMHKLQTGEFHL